MRNSILAIALACLCIGRPSARTAASVSDLLEAYHQGHFDEAVAGAAAITDVNGFVSALTREGPNWSDADPAARQKRRLTLAAFTLEVTRARLAADWVTMRPLLEWACGLLRASGPPTEGERRWNLAVIALGGRWRDYGRLLPATPVWARYGATHVSVADLRKRIGDTGHLAHALQRFPDEPRILLAGALVAGRADMEAPRHYRDDAPIPREPAFPTATATALAYLVPLEDDAALAPEVRMREGHVQYVLTRFPQALFLERSAEETARSRDVAYLAHFLAARVLQAMNRPDEAAGEFARAAAIRPHAQSAAFGVAYYRLLSPQSAPVDAALAPQLAGHGEFDDPWRLYGFGDYMYWPERLAVLREALQ
jgi:hypothetical protein